MRWAATVTACATAAGVVQAGGTAAAAPRVPTASNSAAVTQGSDTVSAMMAARARKSRVEVASDRTAYAQTFANTDGTLTYVSSALPRWVERGSSWVDADATLVANKDGSLSPKAAEAPLTLSGGGAGPLARAGSGAKTLSVSWPTGLPKPRVSGATATYADVLPGVDLVVTASVTGAFEDTLVVKSAAAAKDPGLADLRLKVDLGKGLSQSVDKGGNVTVKDGAGRAVFTSPAAMAWDSATADRESASGVHGPGRGAHRAAVAASYQAGAVDLRAPSLLTDRSTVFPAYIDPAYTVTQAWEGYDETQSAYPTVDELNNTFDKKVSVGFDGGGIDRGYYVLGLPSAADGQTTQVLSATLATTVVTTYTNASTSHTVNAYYTGQVADATTWNTPPTQLAGPSAASFTTASTAPNQAVNFNLASYVQTDLDGYGWQFSVELANSNESDGSQFVEFANNPTLTITYDHAPWSPGTLALSPQNWPPNGSLYTSSLTPTLEAATTDDDGDQIAYQFQVKQGSTVVASGTSGYYASGATGSWKVPTALSDDTTYAMYVRGYDGTAYGNWSSARTFTTDTVAPAAPSVSCPGYPAGAWTALIAAGTSCTFSDSSPMVAGYVYELRNGTGTPVWNWISGSNPTVTIDPTSSGLYTLTVSAVNDAALSSSSVPYYFGVGASGAMLAPADQSQTSTTVALQAAAPTGFTSATFKYRYGTTGSFTTIPSQVVASCGCPVTWPVTAGAGHVGVQTAVLTWSITRTLADDGPVQIEAVFTDSAGHTDTTDPVTVTLDRLGTGTDYGTTAAGPVTVGLQSGNAALSATDVSIASYGAQLSVSRTYNSVAPAKPSIFGPGWDSGIAPSTASSWSSVTDKGSYAVLTASDGSVFSYSTTGTSAGVTSYSGDGPATTAGLTLIKNTTSNAFQLTESSGSATTFTSSASGSSVYVPSTITSPGTSKSVGYVYDATGRPLLVVAPDAASSQPSTTACPSPASASTWTTTGCRGLAFSYDPASGNVSEIDFVYVDATGAFRRVAVAAYSYDTPGQLVGEWDPRLSTPLKATYTYDETAGDADYGRITTVSPAQAASSGALAPWHLTYDDTSSDVNYGKLLTVARTHSATYGGGTAITTLDYSVPLTTAAGGPVAMDSTAVATWGQNDVPASAVAVWNAAHVPASTPTATDYQYATVYYYDANGREVNTATYVNGVWAVSTTEYDTYGNTTRELTAANRATALAAGSPLASAQSLDTRYLYACDNFGFIGACTNSTKNYQVLTDTYGPAHTANADGPSETIRTHTAGVYDVGAPNSDVSASGSPYMLKTSETVSASVGSSVPGSSTADARTTQYAYANGSDTLGWTLGTPLRTITDPAGLAITKSAVYNENSSLYGGDNLALDSYQPSNTSGGGAGDIQTVYYTAGANSVDATCGNQPAWANLACKTAPAAQPSDTNTIPTTRYTYNDYLSVLTKTDAFGSVGTRTTTYTYDAANRPLTQTIAATGTGMGAAVPETKVVYATPSGLPTDVESLNASGGVTADLVSTYDDFGQQLTYTDANGTQSRYTYDLAGRMASKYDGQGTDTVTYSPGGQAVSETDSLAGTFTATYNADGQEITETYPDGTAASRTLDSAGNAVSLSYSNPNWASTIADAITVNAEGDWTARSVLNASMVYSYDNADRLSKVADTQSGSCTTRSYGYDADSNRTTLTSYGPSSGGGCQSSTGITETYTYDTADRLSSSTIASSTATYTYDTQGDITTTPSVDAGGTGNLSAAYYADGLLASQAQNGANYTWTLDPTQSRYATWTNGSTTTVNHYADDGDSPSWSANGTAWSRNVTGLDGQLAATVTSAGSVTLDLTDLHGDVMATVLTANDSAPTATYTYTEFGSVEATSPTPTEYGYLGGSLRSNQALGGQILMGVRGYSTALGRFDSTDPVTGGSANAYDYADQAPTTKVDTTGDYWEPGGITYSGWGGWEDNWARWNQNWLGWFVETAVGNIGIIRFIGMWSRYGYAYYRYYWVGSSRHVATMTVAYRAYQSKGLLAIGIGWFNFYRFTITAPPEIYGYLWTHYA